MSAIGIMCDARQICHLVDRITEKNILTWYSNLISGVYWDVNGGVGFRLTVHPCVFRRHSGHLDAHKSLCAYSQSHLFRLQQQNTGTQESIVAVDCASEQLFSMM